MTNTPKERYTSGIRKLLFQFSLDSDSRQPGFHKTFSFGSNSDFRSISTSKVTPSRKKASLNVATHININQQTLRPTKRDASLNLTRHVKL